MEDGKLMNWFAHISNLFLIFNFSTGISGYGIYSEAQKRRRRDESICPEGKARFGLAASRFPGI